MVSNSVLRVPVNIIVGMLHGELAHLAIFCFKKSQAPQNKG